MTKRASRVKREMRRHGTKQQGHGWAARQASKHINRRTKHENWAHRAAK